VPIQFLAMMISILDMIIVPILAGFVANKILYSRNRRLSQSGFLLCTALVSAVAAVLIIIYGTSLPGLLSSMRNGLVIGSALISLVTLAKWLLNNVLKRTDPWMDRALPFISMLGICLIIAIITARSSADLLRVGLALIFASMLHNLIGYLLAYWLAKAVRLDERTCRTISFEVGMQNGGMATGLAMTVLNSTKSALAPAIFGPWQNVSGSILANYWQRKKIASR